MILNRLCKFLDKNNIKYSNNSYEDENIISFSWISANITYKLMDELETKYNISLMTFSVDRDKLIEVDFHKY